MLQMIDAESFCAVRNIAKYLVEIYPSQSILFARFLTFCVHLLIVDNLKNHSAFICQGDRFRTSFSSAICPRLYILRKAVQQKPPNHVKYFLYSHCQLSILNRNRVISLDAIFCGYFNLVIACGAMVFLAIVHSHHCLLHYVVTFHCS